MLTDSAVRFGLMVRTTGSAVTSGRTVPLTDLMVLKVPMKLTLASTTAMSSSKTDWQQPMGWG
jgi:hypothetical protein